ncbi:CLUMA_CG017639, isoform A, partial [Clunio marinus]
NLFNFSEWTLSSSILTISAALSCILTGFIINKIGRRGAMLLTLVPFLAGWLMLIDPFNPSMLIIGRMLIGIACGGICVSGIIYCCEITENSTRGTLRSFFQLLITSGILLAYILGAFFNPQTASLICGIIPILFGAFMFFCPESPTYLIMKGKQKEAMKALKSVRGEGFEVSSEISELQKEENIRKSKSISEAIKWKSSIKSMLLCFGLMFFQQLSGINVVIFYSSEIFQDARVGMAPEYATIMIGVVQIIATFLAYLILERFGRRLMLVLSGSLMAMCTLVMGIYFGTKDRDESAVDGIWWISLLALCVYIAAFFFGFGPVPWLILSELFSTDIKGIIVPMTGTFYWTLAFVVTILYPPLHEILGHSTCFFIFTFFNILGIFFGCYLVPETKGKSLKEVQVGE